MTLVLSQRAGAVAVLALLAAVGGGHVRDSHPGRVTANGANIFVSPVGDDRGANCRRFATAAAASSAPSVCATVARAISLAAPGDVVQLLPGSYGSLTISRESGSDNPKVIVRGDPQLTHQPSCAPGCTTGNVVVNGLVVCGHGLSVRDLDSTGVYDYVFVGAASCPGTNAVTANHDIELVNVHFNAGTLRGHDLVLRDSRIGPNTHICEDTPAREDNLHIWPDAGKVPWTVPYNITLDGNLIYDAEMSTPGCGGVHSDLVQTLGYRNLTVEGNRLWRCGHSFWQDGVYRGTTISGVNVFRNNFFGGSCSAPGGGYAQLGSGSAATCSGARYAIESNTFATYSNVLLNCPGAAGNAWRNNFVHVGSSAPTTCGSGSWDHNVFARNGTTCGTHAKRCNPAWLYPAAGSADPAHGPDLHVARGDTCLRGGGTAADLTAPRDIDGDLRPLRLAADVGADQYETAEIKIGQSIGRVSLGMTRTSVTAFYGTPRVTRKSRLGRGKPFVELSRYRLHGGSLWIAYASDRAVGVGTSSPYYTTARGAGVSSSLRSVMSIAHMQSRCGRAQIFAGRATTTFAYRLAGSSVKSVWIVLHRFAASPGCGRR